MPPERKEKGGRPRSVRGVTLGSLATAAFVLCALSGAFLIAAYDVHDPARSIAEWLLTNPGAVFLRNVHYWTAQAFLVLTALHVWEHLQAATERRVARGAWLRLVLSVPVIAFLMLSGFLLRGDSDAQQAQRILEEVITQIALAGPLLATFLFGTGDGLTVVYLQHAATATIVVWLVIIEHTRRKWPRAGAVMVVALVASALSLVLSAGLHDGLDPRMKGPWYFVGLQEVLHWTPWPLLVVALGGVGLAALWALPRLPADRARQVKGGLLVALGAYAVLTGVGLFLRGENWDWQANRPDGSSDLRPGWILPLAAAEPVQVPARLPIVFGRPEGCLVCHGEVTGLGDAHRPESVGCAACHFGDPFTLDPQRAHAGMSLVPGNLVNAGRTCGSAACHGSVVPRVERSIMTTFAGVIAVNRRVFGEAVAAGAPAPHVRDLGHGAADSHLRQLCASCHLGQPKTDWGPIHQRSRGGGCNACHLVYSPQAAEQLARYQVTPPRRRTASPKTHPALTVNADNSHCFGCHSRSGRISTSYEGWHELHDPPSVTELATDRTDPAPDRFRRLDDGRYFVRMLPDVHQEGGLDCIDCHTAGETMGVGEHVARKGDQAQVRCEDCHAAEIAATPAAAIDPESRKILTARKWTLAPGERLGRTRSGAPLVNVIVAEDGTARLLSKQSGEAAELRAPLPVCSGKGGHERLSCSACHSAWAPRCASCHTRFDPAAVGYDHLLQREVRGAWIETSGPFEAPPPTLGIRSEPGEPARAAAGIGPNDPSRGSRPVERTELGSELGTASSRTAPRGPGEPASGKADEGHPPREVVDTFVPGMILEIDRNRVAGAPADPVFRRLYARTFAHTIRREARSCESCHNDPVAIGYGRGTLRYEVAEGEGRWRFEPEEAPLVADGLPADAWTGFLQARTDVASTRDDARPFTVEEQQRILRVGACLTCHAEDSEVMRQSLPDFEALLARRSPQCVLPRWP